MYANLDMCCHRIKQAEVGNVNQKNDGFVKTLYST